MVEELLLLLFVVLEDFSVVDVEEWIVFDVVVEVLSHVVTTEVP